MQVFKNPEGTGTGVVLVLDAIEARGLREILANVGGGDYDGIRTTANEISHGLGMAGIGFTDRLSSNYPFRQTGSSALVVRDTE